MRVAIDTISLDLRCWKSKDELKRYLLKFDDRLLLGEPRESERRFYSVTFAPEISPADKPFAVGVLSDGYGVSPQTLPDLSQGLFLIGFDSEVVGVQIHSRSILFRVELIFPFRFLLPIGTAGWLAFHECGVLAINASGDIAWTFSRDVIETAEIKNARIYLRFMDTGPVSLDQVTGAEL